MIRVACIVSLLWVGVTGCLGAVGTLLAAPLDVLVGFFLGAAVGGSLHTRVAEQRRLRAGEPARGVRLAGWPLAVSLLAGAAGGVVLAGLFSLLGVAAFAFLAAVAAGGCVFWARARTRPVPATPPESGGVAGHSRQRIGEDERGELQPSPASLDRTPMTASPVASEWSTERLCRAWRTSYVQLERARQASDQVRDAALVAHLVEVRQTDLDELARRAPAGFATRLASGARAASDPGRYLQDTRSSSPGSSRVCSDSDRRRGQQA